MRSVRPLFVAVLAAAAIAQASCGKTHPVAPVVIVPSGPAATTPAGVVERLGWAVAHRDVPTYSALLTDDFAFVFAANDSAGTSFPGGMRRPQDITSLDHMLVGGGAVPPFTSASVVLDNTLIVQDDPRPGRNPRWHRSIRTHVNFNFVDAQNTVISVDGYALFYVVRGDSALIPAELAQAGAGPDSTRWWLERWEDQTADAAGAPGFDLVPIKGTTMGNVKVRYFEGAQRAAGPRMGR